MTKKASDQLRKAGKVSPYFTILEGDGAGVYFQPPATTKKDRDGNETSTPATPVWICSPLLVSARVRDDGSQNHGYLLEWQDADRKQHSWIMPAELLAGDGAEVRRVLLNGGLMIATKKAAREHLMAFIQESRPDETGLVVFRTGWHGGAYVLPDAVIGQTKADCIHLQSDFTQVEGYEVSGTWQQWRDGVGALCAGNHRPVFAISAAFAAPLLNLLDVSGVGFHIRGASSTGKSTALVLGASVQGNPDPLPKWRATDNALEGFAATRNDALLCLDEMGQADAKVIAQAAYMLAQGQGKMRSQRDTRLRPTATWKTLFLSNGEISLADMLASEGKKVKAGQEVRVIDLPADAGRGLGIFDQIPAGFATSGTFADSLKQAAGQYHGAVFREYLRLLVMECGKHITTVQGYRGDWKAEYVPEGAGGQVLRVADAFAVVAAAGELATDMGLTGWQEGTAALSVAHCFKAWLEHRGGLGSQEEREALRQVKYFFETNGAAMFTPLEVRPKDDRTMYRKGFRDEQGDFYVFPEGFERDICRGFDRGFVVGLLRERGWLLAGADGKATITKRVPVGIREGLEVTGSIDKPIRCFHISATILEAEL